MAYPSDRIWIDPIPLKATERVSKKRSSYTFIVCIFRPANEIGKRRIRLTFSSLRQFRSFRLQRKPRTTIVFASRGFITTVEKIVFGRNVRTTVLSRTDNMTRANDHTRGPRSGNFGLWNSDDTLRTENMAVKFSRCPRAPSPSNGPCPIAGRVSERTPPLQLVISRFIVCSIRGRKEETCTIPGCEYTPEWLLDVTRGESNTVYIRIGFFGRESVRSFFVIASVFIVRFWYTAHVFNFVFFNGLYGFMSAMSKLPILRFSTVSAQRSRCPYYLCACHGPFYYVHGVIMQLCWCVYAVTYIIPKRPLCRCSRSRLLRASSRVAAEFIQSRRAGVAVNDDFRVARGIAKWPMNSRTH